MGDARRGPALFVQIFIAVPVATEAAVFVPPDPMRRKIAMAVTVRRECIPLRC
jgi:hypothetical protein